LKKKRQGQAFEIQTYKGLIVVLIVLLLGQVGWKWVLEKWMLH